MAGLGDLIVRIGANLDDFDSGMAHLSSKLGDVVAEMETKFGGISSAMGNLAVAGAGLTAAVTLPIVGIGAAAIESAGKLEQTQIAFQHFLGGAQQAKDYLAELYQFAATTPFQIGEVTSGAQKLMAMGFAAKEVTPMLRILGDQLSAVGRTENMGQLILAFGEMKAKGVASMKEVRQMITDGVIPATKYMAEALNMSEGQVMDAMKHKAIDATTAINAIMRGMAANTGGMMAEQMASFGAQVSNLKDNVTLTLKALGDELLPYGKMFVSFAGDVLGKTKEMAQWFGQLPEPVKVFSLSLVGVTAAIPALITGVAGLTLGVFALDIALTPIAVTMGLSVGALVLWTGAIGVAAAALAGLGAWVYEHWDAVKAVTVQAWDGVSEAWQSIWGAISGWITAEWAGIAATASSIWQPVSTFFQVIWSGVSEYFTTQWNAISSFLGGVWTGIADTASKLWGGIVAIFQDFIKWAEKIPGVNKLMNLSEAWTSAEALAKKTKELNTALSDLGVGAQKTAFALQTLAEKKADWTTKHQAEVAKLTAEYNLLSASVGQNGITQQKVALAGQHLANLQAQTFNEVKRGASGAEKANKELTKATNELNSAHTTLAQVLCAIYVPAITDVGTAEDNVATARAGVVTAADLLAAAEQNLRDVIKNSPNDHAALAAAELAVKNAQIAAKESTAAYSEA